MLKEKLSSFEDFVDEGEETETVWGLFSFGVARANSVVYPNCYKIIAADTFHWSVFNVFNTRVIDEIIPFEKGHEKECYYQAIQKLETKFLAYLKETYFTEGVSHEGL